MKLQISTNFYKLFKIITITVFCTILTNCATSPQSRIKKNPQIFSELKLEHQKLVKQGKIHRNMPKKAVFLAMGTPDNKISGNREGKSFERWDYNELVPIHEMRMIYAPYYSRNGLPFYRARYYPEVYYIPRRAATVYFRKGLVTSWESNRR